MLDSTLSCVILCKVPLFYQPLTCSVANSRRILHYLTRDEIGTPLRKYQIFRTYELTALPTCR